MVSISIEINQKNVTISNTGNHIEVNPDTLFLKYVHGGHIAKSTGIGLSIVKEICNHYGYSVNYNYENKIHSLIVHFK
ncbi:MAG: GHKL domain-containing protein [Bacteroidales bacterium]|nr:GHKL domain-containing protein [Bacteroidales bacterium]